MPLVVDQINDMINAGVPIEQINKFKEDKLILAGGINLFGAKNL